MFAIGDKVIAKPDTPYSITTNGWKGVVVKVMGGSSIHVRALRGCGVDDVYTVNPIYFDLLEENKNKEEIKMNVKKELIEKEIEQWKGFYNNYDNLSIQIMTDVLARYNKDDRAKMIKDIDEFLNNNISEPITGELMVDSIKADIDSFERINNEAKIAIRTLTWIEEVEDKEIEGEPEENISSKDIDKEKDSDV